MLRRMLSSFGKLAMGASRSRGAIPQLLHPCTMESQLESTRKRSNAIRNSGAAPHVWLPRLPGLDYRTPPVRYAPEHFESRSGMGIRGTGVLRREKDSRNRGARCRWRESYYPASTLCCFTVHRASPKRVSMWASRRCSRPGGCPHPTESCSTSYLVTGRMQA
jgi:hypothetical protein